MQRTLWGMRKVNYLITVLKIKTNGIKKDFSYAQRPLYMRRDERMRGMDVYTLLATVFIYKL